MGSFEDNQNISFLGTKNALNQPVIEQYSEYIGVFKGVGSSAPMIIDNTSFFITYVVDSQGRPIKIPTDGAVLGDITSNFTDTPQASFRLNQPTQLNENLSGEHTITSVGTPTPILYSQIGAGKNDNVEQINLLPPGLEPENSSGVPNLVGSIKIDTVQELSDLTGNSFTFITFDEQVSDGPDSTYITTDLGGSSGTGSYAFDGTTIPNSLNSFTFSTILTIRSRGFLLGLEPGESCEFSLSLRRERGGNFTDLVVQPRTISRPTQVFGRGGVQESTYITATFNFSFTLQSYQIADGDKFFLKLSRESGDDFIIEIQEGGQFNIQQSPPAEDPPNFQTQTPFWEIGAPTILTASAYLSEQYGNLQRPLTSSLDFGFPPIKDPFTVNVGDKIRFEHDENNVFTIYEVISPLEEAASGSRLYLKLNTAVPSNLNRNNFVLYKIAKDGQFITINTQKNDNEDTEFTGIIIPKYINPDFRSNLNNITQELKQIGVIEE